MKKDLKNIEQEVVEELTSKLKSDEGTNKIITQYIKISAQVTRMFLEKYEQETNKD